jgi:predicted DNA-binding protein (MmcQ/YjbR family)
MMLSASGPEETYVKEGLSLIFVPSDEGGRMEIKMSEKNLKGRSEVIRYCMTFPEVFEDEPFHDTNWTCMRIRSNRRIFAWIYERKERIWINVKCDPEWRDFWRCAYQSVLPAYHMNKEHWNSIILDGSIPDQDVKRMIGESYDLCRASHKKRPPLQSVSRCPSE